MSILDSTRFPAREICLVSGHANKGSLSPYTGWVSDDRKHKISDALRKGTNQKLAKKTKKLTSTSKTMSAACAPATVSTATPGKGDTNMVECTTFQRLVSI